MVAALLRFAQALRRNVAAHHKGRDRPVGFAKFCNCSDTGLPVAEMKVRNDEVGARRGTELAQRRQGGLGRRRSHDPAAPVAPKREPLPSVDVSSIG